MRNITIREGLDVVLNRLLTGRAGAAVPLMWFCAWPLAAPLLLMGPCDHIHVSRSKTLSGANLRHWIILHQRAFVFHRCNATVGLGILMGK